MKRSWIWIVIVGVILRLVISGVTFHYDVRAFDFGRYVIQQGHVVDFYDYLGRLPADDPILTQYPADYFIYPPLIYGYHALVGMPFSLLFSQQFLNDFLFNVSEALTDPQIFGHLLLLKMPYLVFDLLIAWLLVKLFTNPKDRFLALVFWMFNPVNLYTTYMMGQFDLIPTALVVASVVLFNRKQPLMAALLLGLGGSFKIYPLFLVIPLMSVCEGWSNRLKVAGMALVGYLLPVMPFLFSDGFRASALVAGQTLKSLYAQIPISGGESIILFVGLLVFVYYLFWYNRRWQLWQRYLLVLTLFFSLTHFHPQWFLWITPWLIVALIQSRMVLSLVVGVIILAYFGEILLFEGGLNVGLLAPLNPGLLESPGLLVGLVDLNLSRSLAQTVLVASLGYIVYHVLRRQDSTD